MTIMLIILNNGYSGDNSDHNDDDTDDHINNDIDDYCGDDDDGDKNHGDDDNDDDNYTIYMGYLFTELVHPRIVPGIFCEYSIRTDLSLSITTCSETFYDNISPVLESVSNCKRVSHNKTTNGVSHTTKPADDCSFCGFLLVQYVTSKDITFQHLL